MNEKVYILSTGNQAPYGVGEIMYILPLAHKRKIKDILNHYHNPPIMRLNSSNGVTLSYIDSDIIETPTDADIYRQLYREEKENESY